MKPPEPGLSEAQAAAVYQLLQTAYEECPAYQLLIDQEVEKRQGGEA
jgi:hypothetical protein